jgi:hypothetical protein
MHEYLEKRIKTRLQCIQIYLLCGCDIRVPLIISCIPKPSRAWINACEFSDCSCDPATRDVTPICGLHIVDKSIPESQQVMGWPGWRNNRFQIVLSYGGTDKELDSHKTKAFLT